MHNSPASTSQVLELLATPSLPGATLLKSTNSPSPNSYQLLTVPYVGMGLCSRLPILCWNFFGLSLHRSYVCYHNGYEFICAIALLCPENTTSLKLFTLSGPYILSTTSSPVSPKPWEVGV